MMSDRRSICLLLILPLITAALAAGCDRRQPAPTESAPESAPAATPAAPATTAPAAEPATPPSQPTTAPAPATEPAAQAPPTTPPQVPSVAPPPVATDPWRGPVLEQQETPGGVIVDDLKFGEGDPVRLSDAVRVHYRGTLDNGREFDSTWKRNEPATFYLTQNIPGWREGMVGMKVGGLRRLIIPAELGYGRTGTATVPPNAMLIFEVELLEIIR
jgi:hypothetical protein